MLAEYFELIKSELMSAITIVGYILILHTLITTILSEIIGTFKGKKGWQRLTNLLHILFLSYVT